MKKPPASDEQADEFLSRLITTHADPVIKGIIRYKLHLRSLTCCVGIHRCPHQIILSVSITMHQDSSAFAHNGYPPNPPSAGNSWLKSVRIVISSGVSALFTINGWALDGFLKVFWYDDPHRTVLQSLVGLLPQLTMLSVLAALCPFCLCGFSKRQLHTKLNLPGGRSSDGFPSGDDDRPRFENQGYGSTPCRKPGDPRAWHRRSSIRRSS